MKYLFGVYDKAAESFINQFFDVAAGIAVRGFQDAAKDNKTTISQHPEDFDLYQLGTFDEQTGLVEQPETGPLKLVAGLGLKVMDGNIDNNVTEEEYKEQVNGE